MTLPSSESAPSQVTAEEIAREFCQRNRIGDQQALLMAILSAAKREGAIEAHEQDALASCGGCKAEGEPHRSPYRVEVYSDNDWWHDNAVRCHAGPIWDALLKLRKGGAEPDGGGR